MSQWGQPGQQQGYQYSMQTGFPGANPQFQPQNQQNPQFQPGFHQGLAPQQTGFPPQAGFIQTQQTGYPGTGSNFHARPPIPPVPPIPSQFQSPTTQSSGFLGTQPQQRPPPQLPQQNNSFLSASPGFGGPGLQSQPTGFPSGGLSAQAPRYPSAGPLVPQMTGFVDPRLQMMQSSFMPANISAPYGAGGAPQLQIQPQLPLQQSFQQHNQAQRGTSAPKMSWQLSKAEMKQYDQIFRAWDAQSTGFISGQTALEVFGASGLDKNDLARIWYARRHYFC